MWWWATVVVEKLGRCDIERYLNYTCTQRSLLTKNDSERRISVSQRRLRRLGGFPWIELASMLLMRGFLWKTRLRLLSMETLNKKKKERKTNRSSFSKYNFYLNIVKGSTEYWLLCTYIVVPTALISFWTINIYNKLHETSILMRF